MGPNLGVGNYGKCVQFIEVSSFRGVLIKEVPLYGVRTTVHRLLCCTFGPCRPH